MKKKKPPITIGSKQYPFDCPYQKQCGNKRVEFSKMILFLVMIAYFVTVGVDIKLSFIDYTQYSTLALLVGAPTGTAIAFYSWKAKNENTKKIEQSSRQTDVSEDDRG